jgi:succinate dehydrogenase hydrophobic anchor subunit
MNSLLISLISNIFSGTHLTLLSTIKTAIRVNADQYITNYTQSIVNDTIGDIISITGDIYNKSSHITSIIKDIYNKMLSYIAGVIIIICIIIFIIMSVIYYKGLENYSSDDTSTMDELNDNTSSVDNTNTYIIYITLGIIIVVLLIWIIMLALDQKDDIKIVDDMNNISTQIPPANDN